MAKTAIAYDPEIILEFAGRLYRQAASILITYTLIGAIIGGILGGVLSHMVYLLPLIGIGCGAIIFGLIGSTIAKGRAFELKLQAQNALCQVEIEKNTRT